MMDASAPNQSEVKGAQGYDRTTELVQQLRAHVRVAMGLAEANHFAEMTATELLAQLATARMRLRRTSQDAIERARSELESLQKTIAAQRAALATRQAEELSVAQQEVERARKRVALLETRIKNLRQEESDRLEAVLRQLVENHHLAVSRVDDSYRVLAGQRLDSDPLPNDCPPEICRRLQTLSSNRATEVAERKAATTAAVAAEKDSHHNDPALPSASVSEIAARTDSHRRRLKELTMRAQSEVSAIERRFAQGLEECERLWKQHIDQRRVRELEFLGHQLETAQRNTRTEHAASEHRLRVELEREHSEALHAEADARDRIARLRSKHPKETYSEDASAAGRIAAAETAIMEVDGVLARVVSEAAQTNDFAHLPFGSRDWNFWEPPQHRHPHCWVHLGHGLDVDLSFSLPLGGGFHLLVDAAADPDVARSLVDNALARILATTPAGRLAVYAYDPAGRGGIAAMLSKLAPKLGRCEHTVSALFKSLDEEIIRPIRPSLPLDAISVQKLGESERSLLSDTLVVLFDFPQGFEAKADRSHLEQLMESAHQWGITILATVAEWPESWRASGVNALHRAFRLSPTKNQLAECAAAALAAGDDSQHRIRFRPEARRETSVAQSLVERSRAKRDAPPADWPAIDDLVRTNLGALFGNWEAQSGPADQAICAPVGRTSSGALVELEFSDAAVHSLVVGQVGSGKSKFVAGLVTAFALKYSPKDVEIWMLDARAGSSELNPLQKNPLPHTPVVFSGGAIAISNCMQSVDDEMKRRSELFKAHNAASFVDMRKISRQKKIAEHLPRLVLVLDEFLSAFDGETESITSDLADVLGVFENVVRNSRKCGIHVLLSGQHTNVAAHGLRFQNVINEAATVVLLKHQGAPRLNLPRFAATLAQESGTANEVASLDQAEGFLLRGREALRFRAAQYMKRDERHEEAVARWSRAVRAIERSSPASSSTRPRGPGCSPTDLLLPAGYATLAGRRDSAMAGGTRETAVPLGAVPGTGASICVQVPTLDDTGNHNIAVYATDELDVWGVVAPLLKAAQGRRRELLMRWFGTLPRAIARLSAEFVGTELTQQEAETLTQAGSSRVLLLVLGLAAVSDRDCDNWMNKVLANNTTCQSLIWVDPSAPPQRHRPLLTTARYRIGFSPLTIDDVFGRGRGTGQIPANHAAFRDAKSERIQLYHPLKWTSLSDVDKWLSNDNPNPSGGPPPSTVNT